MEKFTNSVRLLRIPFSIYLMPIFWFSMLTIELDEDNILRLLLIFAILHIIVYPASNGYNSYFDKDEGSIGGLEKPPPVHKQLFWLVLSFDILAVVLSLLLNVFFAIGVFVYLMVSKAYSWDKIRLKKWPIASTVVVTFFQGAFVFALVHVGVNKYFVINLSHILLASTSTLFLAGSYPITQIYQHFEDKKRGDKTLSLLLGIKGTFVFSSIMFAGASVIIAWAFIEMDKVIWLIPYAILGLPILFFFGKWVVNSQQNKELVNFKNTMKMNKISSICLSAAFLLMKLLDTLL